ncbi:serine hydrolase [Pseudoalteromonas umbrosa]|uniref:serine hydrolase n=1 Tax=Pseudoalteromonas umbrosa TaxID=3048489 RepID=UPI0024C23B08|nr:serine hydrolase [Pseudoalteromonas sp. B95]MDK1287637.1 serine hydrolase [Pseudoalteromonas sp. B95]
MKRLTLSIITTAILLSGCDKDNDVVVIAPEKPAMIESFNGLWEIKGTGEVWDLSSNGLVTYNFNSNTCIKADEESAQFTKPLADYLSLNDEKDQLTFNSPASSKVELVKLDALPSQCGADNLTTDMTLPEIFDYVWLSLDEYYGFFELRDINWQAVYDTYKPKVTASTSHAEFMIIMDEIFTEFGDGHLSLEGPQGEQADGSKIDSWIKEGIWNGDGDINDNLAQLQAKELSVLKHLMSDGQVHSFEGTDAIRFGHISPELGYIRIDRVSGMIMDDVADNILSRVEQDLDNTDLIMTHTLEQLHDADSIIIDLRYNQGGFDKVSQKIAGYFTDSDYTFGTKQISNEAFKGEAIDLDVTSNTELNFTKQIYVLIGEHTISGGEVLAMALQSLPHSQLIGEATNGSVSDTLTHQLPNGWELTLSHEVYKNQAGEVVEGVGIEPDIETYAYATVDHKYMTDTPIEYVMQQQNVVSSHAKSADKLQQAVREVVTKTSLPSISVAVIKNDKVVFEHAEGFANLEQNIPATVNTPYNVASISKAVTGVAIMQLVEEGALSLDDKLTEMNLSFDPNNPQSPSSTMTLRHLVTHTSGIKDSDRFFCTYYKYEDQLPLATLFGLSFCEEDIPVTTSLEQLLEQDYFSEQGRYVGSGVYLDGEYGQAGEVMSYSNMGTALAAHAVEKKAALNLAEYMSESIFEPLGMNNTQWDHTKLSADNPKALQYNIDEAGTAHALPEYGYATLYDGELNISSHDLSKLLAAVANQGSYQGTQILNAESVKQLIGAQSDVFNIPYQQGVFWYWDGTFFGHNGGDPGTNTLMIYNALTKTGVIMLTNGEDFIRGKEIIQPHLDNLAADLYRFGVQYK